jgi:hypothetical protein
MLLLLAFYLIAGLLQQLLRGAWARRMVAEYALVGMVVLVLILLLAP